MAGDATAETHEVEMKGFGASLADLAHELRTPLGGIEAMADLLSAASPGEQKRLIAGLKAAAAHLRALASHIIDGQGAPDAIYQTEPAPVNLAAFLEPIAASATARSGQLGGRFILDCVIPRPVSAVIDALRVRQMIENLLDNAFKVGGKDEVRLKVSLENGALTFCVLDRGKGFSPADIEKLFSRGTQIEGGPAGSGIGLSLIKRYAEACGGSCGAAARRDRGAEVWFTLPDVVGEPVEPEPRRHALVIEDSYAGRLLMRTMLEHFGFSVDLAVGASSALEAIARQGYDLITVDKMLGDCDGIDVTRMIRDRIGKGSATKIVAVTGRVDEADRLGFVQAGADAFLPKPLSPRAMAEVLRRLSLGATDPAEAA
jgi:two-component system, sensor histidine kinase